MQLRPQYEDITEFFTRDCPQCSNIIARTDAARYIIVMQHHREAYNQLLDSEMASRRILGIALRRRLNYKIDDLERVETNTLKTMPITCMMLGAYHSKLLHPSMKDARTIQFGQILKKVRVDSNNGVMTLYEDKEDGRRRLCTCYVRVRGDVVVDKD